jgi:hypothetical protein
MNNKEREKEVIRLYIVERKTNRSLADGMQATTFTLAF